MTEQELLKDCLDRLSRSGLNYMLVGSMAGNYWGIPRSTHDIDFVIEYEAENIDQIVGLFENEFFIQKTSVEAALRAPHQFNALDNRSALKVDFFRLAGDPYEMERFRRRRPAKILGVDAWIATPEDIVLHKLRWYSISPSDRQLTDAAGILSVSSDIMDNDYLTHWADQIGVVELLNKVKSISSGSG